ncbi:MAG: hypothetical protein DDT20_00681 [Firmicutes bacterium]|nr:hypothetical protein [Bacillota bacterium]
MPLRFSPALQNFIAASGSWKDFFDEGSIEIYSGTQPATPDLAVTGTLLVTLTSGGSAKTHEVASQGTVTLTGGASGSVDTLTVNSLAIMDSATPFNASLTQTAADIARKCMRNPRNKLFTVTSSGAVITITANPGQGTLPNGWVVASTVTTITKTDVNMGVTTAGVNAVNGLRMDFNPVAGMFTKDLVQTWSGTAVATGTAGWFRYESSVVDAGALDSAAVFLRMDGNIATSGADMTMSSTTITSGAVQTLGNFHFTIPAA